MICAVNPHKSSPNRARTRATAIVFALAAGLAGTTVGAPAQAAPAAPAATAVAKPTPPPTRGVVTGKVVGVKGAPLRNALVTALRFSDFGLPVDLSEEARVVARTDASGRFSLKQLTEPYVLRICSESGTGAGGGGHRAGTGECATEPAEKQFTPAYVGPDGITDSWLQQTRLFQPRAPRRAVGTVRVSPPAVLEGVFRGSANRTVYLLRSDNSIAEQVLTGRKGTYRFEVAPGRYRLEADRHEGLRTDSTVPGFRSKKLTLRAGRITQLNFRTRHAGTVRGQVTSGGQPVADQFLAILDADGDFAAGVATDGQGKYVVSSLEPGQYTIRTSASFSSYEAAAKTVTLTQKGAKTVDFALSQGSTLKFDAAGGIDAELRNSEGRVVKVYQGVPADEPGGEVVFKGLSAGTYELYVRRITEISDGPEQTDFPWKSQPVTIAANSTQDLNTIALSESTLNLTGTIPKGSQVKITAIPEDPWLRESHVDGDQTTPMALNWTEKANEDGTYVVRGIVPGTYTVAVTTAYEDSGNGPTSVGANVATTHATVTVTTSDTTESFTAPVGATVTGQLRYASNHRPVIAPIGYRVFDKGDQSWLFPTVSGPQKYGRGFRVQRLHAGTATGTILDLEALYGEHEDVLIPDSLVSSSRLAERAAPYWFKAKKKTFTLTAGQTVDLGFVNVVLKGR
jgi:hypothetical protein